MVDQRVLEVSEDVMFKWRLLVEEGRNIGHTFSQPDLIIAATALQGEAFGSGDQPARIVAVPARPALLRLSWCLPVQKVLGHYRSDPSSASLRTLITQKD